MNDVKMSRGRNLLFCVIAVLIALVLLFPMLWMLNTSLKTEAEIFQNPPTLYPHTLNLKSYIAQIETGDFNMFRSFFNSLVISMGSMLIAVVLAVPASYAIARYRFKGHKSVLLGFLVTQMLPVSVLLTPMFIMFRNMHLYNTWGAPILADATIGIPFSVLILKNYFASIPRDLEEAAYIDGCMRFGAFMRILVPVAKPGVAVCAIFSFLYAWGDLAYGMTFILEQPMRPITAGIFNFMGQYGTKWSYLSAFAVVSMIPVAIIFVFMQKYMQGLSRDKDTVSGSGALPHRIFVVLSARLRYNVPRFSEVIFDANSWRKKTLHAANADQALQHPDRCHDHADLRLYGLQLRRHAPARHGGAGGYQHEGRGKHPEHSFQRI